MWEKKGQSGKKVPELVGEDGTYSTSTEAGLKEVPRSFTYSNRKKGREYMGTDMARGLA